MENMIPLNGRIAIVDDQIEQALPLMRVFAKNNIPYVFYKGTAPEFLPERPENDTSVVLVALNHKFRSVNVCVFPFGIV